MADILSTVTVKPAGPFKASTMTNLTEPIANLEGNQFAVEVNKALRIIPVDGGALVAAGGLLVTTGILLGEQSVFDKMEAMATGSAGSSMVRGKLHKSGRDKDAGSIFLYVLGLVLILIGILKSFTNIASAVLGIFAVIFYGIGTFMFRQEMFTMEKQKRRPWKDAATSTILIGFALLIIANLIQNWQNRWETVILLIAPVLIVILGYMIDRRASLHPVHMIRYVITTMSIGWIMIGASIDGNATIIDDATFVAKPV